MVTDYIRTAVTQLCSGPHAALLVCITLTINEPCFVTIFLLVCEIKYICNCNDSVSHFVLCYPSHLIYNRSFFFTFLFLPLISECSIHTIHEILSFLQVMLRFLFESASYIEES